MKPLGPTRPGGVPEELQRTGCADGAVSHLRQTAEGPWSGSSIGSATDEGSEKIYLYRGLCRTPQCPVVTVTRYPSFITPYQLGLTEMREGVVRA